MGDINASDSGLIDISSRSAGHGGINTATYNALRGIDALGGLPPLPANTDSQGFVFFTKPCMNLSYNNVIGTRKLKHLATDDPYSMGNAIRCMLSPAGFETGPESTNMPRSAIIDDKCAFLPVSNMLLTLSPPPDWAADTYTSRAGYAGEQVTWIDTKPGYNGVFDLTASFTNMEGDFIGATLETIYEYQARVLEGAIIPFPVNMWSNRIDYMTRPYRFVMDRTKTYIQKAWMAGAGMFTTVPVGAAFGYDRDSHLNTENNQIQTNLRCMISITNDPIIPRAFNITVEMFNPEMKDKNRAASMVKVVGAGKHGENLKALMKYDMYPHINESTMELEWYAPKATYETWMKIIESMAPDQPPQQPANKTATNEPKLSPWTNSLSTIKKG